MSEIYDYREAMRDDIKEAFENGEYDLSDGYEKIYEDMWIDDSITGNASGSYYCNAWKAEEALNHNWDLLSEALSEFGCEVDVLEKGAEYCDVTIRCYLLGEILQEVIDELEEEAE